MIFIVAFLKMMSFLGNLICYHSFELSDISQITALGSRDEEKETWLVLCFCFICVDCISLVFVFFFKIKVLLKLATKMTILILYPLLLSSEEPMSLTRDLSFAKLSSKGNTCN